MVSWETVRNKAATMFFRARALEHLAFTRFPGTPRLLKEMEEANKSSEMDSETRDTLIRARGLLEQKSPANQQ